MPVPMRLLTIATQFHIPAGDDNPNPKSLCEKCWIVNWPQITTRISGGLWCNHGILLTFKRESRTQLLNSGCCICRLVGSLFSPSLPSEQRLSFDLVSVSHQLGFFKPLARIAVEPHTNGDHIGYIIACESSENKAAGLGTLEPSQVNFDFFKMKLKECFKDHEECRSTGTEIANLRVIDVYTNEICQAPLHCDYTALSYVWGCSSCQNDKKEFPLVVQDAITATKALGCRFLWVDRYCINQDPNSLHKRSMIEQMDRVYANAWVTIIAASGSSAWDGLPGMSGPPRHQGRATIGQTHLIGISNVGSATIKLSKWATRGWTYQEGYLSRRRLIFTDTEVLFLCNKGFAKETQIKDEEQEIITMNSLLWMIPPAKLSVHRSLYIFLRRHIEEYSNRNLSKDCDSLNAFVGILKYYESKARDANGPVSHLWGVPLKLRSKSMEGQVFFDLPWKHQSIAYRRDSLPSWSWSGWGGPVRFPNTTTDEFQGTAIGWFHVPPPRVEYQSWNRRETSSDCVVERIIRIRVVHCDRTIDMRDFIQERQVHTNHIMDPKELLITSFIVPLRFRKVEVSKKTYDMPTFAVGTGIFLGCPVHFDRGYNPESHKLGLILPSRGRFYDSYMELDEYYIIVLHPMADGKYERAGIMSLYYNAPRGVLRQSRLSVIDSIYLDEQNNIIEPELGHDLAEGPPNGYSFLGDAKWETVCLI
ncbi:heterokaryon incompatibility protein-domain-containing protein [Annulohypoxylon nitens]|nr:heterokaryon incompatibility protein-domain-containing protein [Annulohypoxylon nitens]